MSESVGWFYTQLPWSFITKFHEGNVVQKDGILQRTFAYRAPDLDSSDAAEVNSLALRVNDFAKRLGSGWAFQVEAQRYYTSEYQRAEFKYRSGNFDSLAPYLVDREREQAFMAYGKHFESSYYITFIWRPPSENVKKLTQMFIKSDGGQSKNIEENVTHFVNETNAIIGIIGQNMLIAPLDNDETVAYLHSSISLNRFPLRFPATSILLDRILPDEELQTSLTMKLGNNWIPIIGISDFPQATYPAILDELNRERLEYRWVSRYICLDKEEGKKEAQKKEKAHRGNKKTFLQTFAESTSGEASQSVNHGASVKENDAIDAGIEIETDMAALGFYTSCVMVWDEDYDRAKKKADTVKNVINSAGFTCKEETFNALEAFKSMMPGQIYANFRSLPVMTNTLSHVIPLSSVWAGMRRNEHAYHVCGVDIPHITCSTAEGTPFYLNINPTDVGHTAFWGPTGAGKSTALNGLEIQFFKYFESQVIVFDKDRSCRQLCLACGGLFYEPGAENIAGISFQPLRDLETDRELLDAIDFIEACFTVNGYKVTPPIRAAIKENIELLKDKPKESRTLTSFVHYADAFKDPETGRAIFKEHLGDYLWGGGKFGKIFDSSNSSVSLDSRYICFEMGELIARGEGCVAPALVYLFNLVEKMFTGKLTMLVLDEAWLFLKNEIFAEKITEWLKTLRKKNVFVVFATQDVADVYNSPLKTTIIQQCLTKIYLADPSAVTAGMIDVYRGFGLTDSEIGLIASAQMKRDYFYTSPLGRRLFQFDFGKVTLGLLAGTNHEFLDRLIATRPEGTALCKEILASKGIEYRHLLGFDAPKEVEIAPVERKKVEPKAPEQFIEEPYPKAPTASGIKELNGKIAEFLEAAEALPEKKGKHGAGRAANTLAKKFSVNPSTVYLARRILRSRNADLIAGVKDGILTLTQAGKILKMEKSGAVEQSG